MNPQEKTQILAALDQGRAAFLSAIEGVSDSAAAHKPAPERWSVLECAEHVAAVEATLLALVKGAETAAAPDVNPQREALIMRHGANRARRIEAPEAVRPTGRVPNLGAAVESFNERRRQTLQFLEACEEDLRARTLLHPRLGQINAHEALLLLAVHPLRHAQQIEEAKKAAASPVE